MSLTAFNRMRMRMKKVEENKVPEVKEEIKEEPKNEEILIAEPVMEEPINVETTEEVKEEPVKRGSSRSKK